ncbi:C40 family peptidase [bacterium]|nr:C40 family peptidase [bacterium]
MRPPSDRIGVVVQNVVSLRAEPDSKSEQVTQALIGQNVTIEDGSHGWLYVQTWDTYRAWLPASAVRILPSGSEPYASVGAVAIIRELLVDMRCAPSARAQILTKATISAELEVVDSTESWVELLLPDNRHAYIRKNKARLIDKDLAQTIPLPDPRKLVETARRFVGIPYLWGGSSPFGIDCSGFVQLVYKVHGVTLFRDACHQAKDPRAVPVEQDGLRAGDLVFFAKSNGNVSHVGMMIDMRRFIHSRGSFGVGITPIDDPYYTSIYYGARKMRLATLDPGGGAIG